jgi:O6-methylguanine-DNA--protein-cysteine methyltransferase
MSPTAFRKGGQDSVIRFAVGECSLGSILVAASDKGVCAIQFGDDPDALVRDLQDRFPKAQLIGADRNFEQLIAQVVGFGEAPARGLDMPLDVRGTAFQQRVWQALREIPAGATTSYAEIARRIGRPKAVRAVAQACASNRHRGRDPLPSRGAQRRRAVRLSLGRGPQARPARHGVCSMNVHTRTRPATRATGAATGRVQALDWNCITDELAAQGSAMMERLLSPEECREIASLYPEDRFRSKIVMGRHGFGSGEYKYFAYPLPDLIEGFRTALYPRLAPIANHWNELMRIDARYPARHADFLDLCHKAGQTRPTPLLLQYGAGDYNCVHQDLYGDLAFPLQVAILLSEPGRDHTGGEFVLTEQRPRMQSRPEVVPLRQGDAVVFAVHHRPVNGTRGTYRVNLRHGVSRVRSGRRHTLGIIFHDAK